MSKEQKYVLDILRHKRRLNAYLDKFDLDELRHFQNKVNEIVDERIAEETARQEAYKKKRQVIENLLSEAENMGVSRDDLIAVANTNAGKPPETSKPVKPKYQFNDNGESRTWSGRGIMPRALRQAVDAGQPLESFLIK